MVDNSVLLGYVKEITVAKLSSSDKMATQDYGKQVAEFMQEIYDKLSELNKSEAK